MRRNAFTFIEVIISITIFTIVLITVYSAFNIGIKTWRRSHAGIDQHRIRLALMKIEKELKDSFFFSKIPFRGTRQKMIFPLSVSDVDTERIYIVTYSISVDEKTGLSELVREERPFSEREEKEDDIRKKIKKILSSAKSIRFEYAYQSKELSKNFKWEDSWDGDKQGKFPAGVKISLELDGNGEIYNKIIFIQNGNLGVE